MRCLSAAGCSDEGKQVLLQLVRQRPPQLPEVALVTLLQTAVGPSDPAWAACLDAVEPIALDESRSIEVRVQAAQIAVRGETKRPFRQRYIAAAIRSGNKDLLGKHCPGLLHAARGLPVVSYGT